MSLCNSNYDSVTILTLYFEPDCCRVLALRVSYFTCNFTIIIWLDISYNQLESAIIIRQAVFATWSDLKTILEPGIASQATCNDWLGL